MLTWPVTVHQNSRSGPLAQIITPPGIEDVALSCIYGFFDSSSAWGPGIKEKFSDLRYHSMH